MISHHWFAACVPLLVSSLSSASDSPPATTISNGLVRAKVYLPDAQTGFYRGTRFDWSGVIGDLEYAGHNFYPQWYARLDPKVVDFAYEGADIVAGPCTAITGPCEEFSTQGKALGFDTAKPGGTFIKIGVGVLQKPDEASYSMFRVYELVDGGKWTVHKDADAVQFRQILSDSTSGFGYDYRKVVRLSKGQPQLVLEHTLRNTGQRPIQSSVYNHNFLFLDRQAPGPDMVISLPFQVQAKPKLDAHVARIENHQVLFAKTLGSEERVYAELVGSGASAQDYDVRVENHQSGVGVRATSDRPLARLALWAIRAPLCVEPFIEFKIEPGAEFTWRIVYDYCTK